MCSALNEHATKKLYAKINVSMDEKWLKQWTMWKSVWTWAHCNLIVERPDLSSLCSSVALYLYRPLLVHCRVVYRDNSGNVADFLWFAAFIDTKPDFDLCCTLFRIDRDASALHWLKVHHSKAIDILHYTRHTKHLRNRLKRVCMCSMHDITFCMILLFAYAIRKAQDMR